MVDWLKFSAGVTACVEPYCPTRILTSVIIFYIARQHAMMQSSMYSSKLCENFKTPWLRLLLAGWVWLTLRNKPRPRFCYSVEFDSSGSKVKILLTKHVLRNCNNWSIK